MGILDDAIRQHLELKRQRGATDSELEQLEHEAFGPSSRPGEPDFPDSEGAHEQSGNGAAAHATETAHDPEPSAGQHPVVEPSDEARGTEVAEAPPEPEPVEPVTGSEEQTAIFDQTTHADPELEEPEGEQAEPPAEDEPEEPAPEASEPGPEEPSGAGEEAPIESLDTVEHRLPDVEPEPEPEAAGEEHEDAQDAEKEEEAGAGEESEDDDEDVLADTPEFLKDAPEDDELWFEQGKPKDFDF